MMKCPACRAPLTPGEELCPACGAVVAPAVDGALAPDPRAVTPPSRPKGDAIREIPALRGKRDKREGTWKDEVRERVRHRRRLRDNGEEELPLFRDAGRELEPSGAEQPQAAQPAAEQPQPLADPYALGETPLAPAAADAAADLPLRPPTGTGLPSRADPEPDAPEDEADWRLELPPPVRAARPVERPALAGERALASALDLGLLAVLAATVLYFTLRAARVELLALTPVWPWLLGYLGLLGLGYAAYFTGTTGQTPGKMAASLRVVDTAGRPPGYLRAALRALVGTAGIALAGLGLLPMFFDPARRALHDRLFGTRVVRG